MIRAVQRPLGRFGKPCTARVSALRIVVDDLGGTIDFFRELDRSGISGADRRRRFGTDSSPGGQRCDNLHAQGGVLMRGVSAIERASERMSPSDLSLKDGYPQEGKARRRDGSPAEVCPALRAVLLPD